MEEYFEKYKDALAATEAESPLTEEDFARYCRRRSLNRRIIAAVSALAAAAAIALVVVFAFTPARPAPGRDAVAVYIKEYTDAVRPIYKDIVGMEEESALCSALNLSSVLKDMLDSVHHLNRDMKGVDSGRRMAEIRAYCEARSEDISRLYSDCITTYTLDCGDIENH